MNEIFRFGPLLQPDEVTFRLWAPAATRVEVVLDRPHEMMPNEGGWYEAMVPGAGAGTLYKFRIDGDIDVPDPASPFQPADVHGPSEVIDHAYTWRTQAWRGRPWTEAMLLELHVGAFTPRGTFRGAIEKLDHLAEAGFTAIQLMPVSDFAGRCNWGYDSVLPYAPDNMYGRPEDLKTLIDAAHQRGLMVFLEVVYSHFGLDGNYLGRYAPQFLARDRATPWGVAIDYRVPEVRAFAVQNALHWLRDYRFDGLRLDGVHAIIEPGEPSVLDDISLAVGAFAAQSGRLIHLVLENNGSHVSSLDPFTNPSAGKYRAQWNDDIRNVWHAILARETSDDYRDHAEDARQQLARLLQSGSAYRDEIPKYRGDTTCGESSGDVPNTAFVPSLRNRGRVDKRSFGNRLALLASPEAIEAALAVMLLAPMPPLMFMGEEWGSTQPFPFFCDFIGELADAAHARCTAEFKDGCADTASETFNPLSAETFQAAVLDWTERESDDGRMRLDLVRRLLTRRKSIVQLFANLRSGDAQAECNNGVVTASWRLTNSGRLHLVANLNGAAAAKPDNCGSGMPLWGGVAPRELPPWSVFWSMS